MQAALPRTRSSSIGEAITTRSRSRGRPKLIEVFGKEQIVLDAFQPVPALVEPPPMVQREGPEAQLRATPENLSPTEPVHAVSMKRRPSREKLALRRFVHARPTHLQYSASPLSKESPIQDYRGFLNLCVLLLFVNNVRLAVENLLKYGLLLSFPDLNENLPPSDRWACLYAVLFMGCSLVLSFLCEVWASQPFDFTTCRVRLSKDGLPIKARSFPSNHISWYLLCFLSLFLTLAGPIYFSWNYIYHPLFGSLIMGMAIVLEMKLVSYHLVQHDLRSAVTDQTNDENAVPQVWYAACPYPRNVTIGNLSYFIMAPTLCYQPVYPRTVRIRKSFLFKRILECITASMMIVFLVQQYAVPTVRNSLQPLLNGDVGPLVERLLKLSMTSLYVWLLGFYGFFHAYLNAVGEALRFADRSFYADWWNAKTLDAYWRLWNMPVHAWFKRHMYGPLRARGFSARTAQLVAFFVSATIHELGIGIPTKVLQMWAFLAMISQVPLMMMTSEYMRWRPSSSFGNYLFWLSFCILGQPMCVLLYYRAWVQRT